ncbi:hypothetical protein [Ornithinimicrobium kibberense]|uniref:hypothetical protein n=1 Tax=Ornithinimicrobium kibberense TaxID=282060 RepID=UPI00361A8EF2
MLGAHLAHAVLHRALVVGEDRVQVDEVDGQVGGAQAGHGALLGVCGAAGSGGRAHPTGRGLRDGDGRCHTDRHWTNVVQSILPKESS